MKWKKIIISISLISLITLITILSTKGNITTSIRNLIVTEYDVAHLCKTADWDTFQVDHLRGISTFSKTFASLTTSQTYLLYLIATEDLTKLKDYVISYAPLVIFVCCAFVTMIIWMIYIACAKYPRYCFKRKPNAQQTTKGKVFYFLLNICYGLVILCSIIGYIYSNLFSDYIESATCALLSSFNDLINGQSRNTNTTVAPTWVGMNKLEIALYNTLRSADQMRIITPNVFKNCDWTAIDPVRYQKEIINLELNYSITMLPSPNPQKELTYIRPVYLSNYTSSASGTSHMRNIQVEFEKKIKDASESMVKLRSNFFSLRDNFIEIKSKFNEINIIMRSLKYYVTKLNEDFLSDWMFYHRMANVGFHVFFLFLYAIHTVCVVGQFVIFIILNNFNKRTYQKKFQIAANVLWNIYAFMIIFSFMSGFGFIVTSYASVDSLHVLGYLFGTDNLLSEEPIIVANNTIGSYINTCLHSDGKLTKNFFLDNTPADNLNVIYNSAYVLRNTKQVLYQETKTESIPKFYKPLNSYVEDIYTVTNATYGVNDVRYVFDEFSHYTSGHYHDYQSICELNTLDTLVPKQNYCPADYTYIDSSNIMDKGDKRCLVYDEWHNGQLQQRYKRACPLKAETKDSSVKFYTVANASSYYLDSLFTFRRDNIQLVNDLTDTFFEFEKAFNVMSDKMLKNIIEVEPLINISYNVYHDLIGDNEMYSMFDCSYFQTYFSKLYYYLYDKVSPSALVMGVFMLINSLFGFASLLFLFFSKAEYIPWEEEEESSLLIPTTTSSLANQKVVNEVLDEKKDDSSKNANDSPKFSSDNEKILIHRGAKVDPLDKDILILTRNINYDDHYVIEEDINL